MEVYCKLLKESFESHSHLMQKSNHSQHNAEPNYWNILLADVTENPKNWSGKTALDFGCGCGRNITNLYKLAEFNRVDGVDICGENAKFAQKHILKTYPNAKTKTWETNGWDVMPCKDNTYDFIMSHQVFQHISNYDVRFSLLTDLYRVMKNGGVLSVHFLNLSSSVDYHFSDDSTLLNVTIDDPNIVVDDLTKIGFKDITFIEKSDFYEQRREFYFRGIK